MIGLDQLRTAYVQAPPKVRRLLSPVLSLLPTRLRFGGTYTEYREHINRSRKDLSFITTWRLNHLRALIKTAITRSPHYQHVAKHIGLDPEMIDTFEIADLEKFPILKRSDVEGRAEDFLTVPLEKLDRVSTGGTTGDPLRFYLDNDRSAKEWAFVQDSLSNIGLQPGDVRTTFRGESFKNVGQKPWEFEPALNELRLSPFRLTFEQMEAYCGLIRRYDARYIQGYASAIAAFSNYLLCTQTTDISNKISGILTVSEPLYDHQRSRITAAFPKAQLLSTYGLSEKVLFGSQDPSKPGIFDLEPLYGIAELVDEQGQPVVEPGATGRLVGTGLLFHGLPFIRYDTGDIAELVEPASPSNLFRMKIKTNVLFRWRGLIVGSQNELISMVAINVNSAAHSKMLSFQFQQTQPGLVTLRAIPAPGCSRADLKPFVEEIAAKIGNSVVFEIELVDDIVTGSLGWVNLVDQKIDLSKYQ